MERLEGGPRVGFDLVELARFERAMARHPRMVERIFTAAEIAYCGARKRPALHFAARFAAKEAVGKLLGSGIVAWREIEVVRDSFDGQGGVTGRGAGASAEPLVTLRGSTAQLAEAWGIGRIRVSLSHVGLLAGACAVAVAGSGEGADDGRLSGS
jgi:holo-[acyl-carrier protein] synthase